MAKKETNLPQKTAWLKGIGWLDMKLKKAHRLEVISRKIKALLALVPFPKMITTDNRTMFIRKAIICSTECVVIVIKIPPGETGFLRIVMISVHP